MELLRTLVRGQWDRVASWAAFALAALLLFLGWLGTSDSVFTTQQIPYLISGGCGGLLLSAIGATLWLSADLRDEWRKLDEIHDDLRALSAQPPAEIDHALGAAGNGTEAVGSAPSRPKAKRTSRGQARSTSS